MKTDKTFLKRILVIGTICCGSVFIAGFIHGVLLMLSVSNPISLCVNLKAPGFGAMTVQGSSSSIYLKVLAIITTIILAVLIARYTVRWANEGID